MHRSRRQTDTRSELRCCYHFRHARLLACQPTLTIPKLVQRQRWARIAKEWIHRSTRSINNSTHVSLHLRCSSISNLLLILSKHFPTSRCGISSLSFQQVFSILSRWVWLSFRKLNHRDSCRPRFVFLQGPLFPNRIIHPLGSPLSHQPTFKRQTLAPRLLVQRQSLARTDDAFAAYRLYTHSPNYLDQVLSRSISGLLSIVSCVPPSATALGKKKRVLQAHSRWFGLFSRWAPRSWEPTQSLPTIRYHAL